MAIIRRRTLLGAAGAALAASAAPGGRAEAAPEPQRTGSGLDLRDFQPRSMLHVPETKVPRAKFPVIDVHTHLTFSKKGLKGVSLGEEIRFNEQPENLLPVMDRRNLRLLVNLTGGTGKGTQEAIARLDRAHPGRFLTFTEPSWAHFLEPNFPQFQADEIERAHKAGARGLKVVKTLGLYLREKITEGPLVKVDDRRLDPMWEACAAFKMPVAIHVSDPEAFFLPIDRFNERWEELYHHPDWSFHGRDFPSNMEILEARNRVYARHPRTQFISLHMGHDAENLPYVAECMDKFPNMTVELAARVGELGRQPRQSRKFFERYQDRIMFGTDAVPHGDETPQQVYGDLLYEIYFRFLETEDEYFDYAPAAVPPQGRWRIYGLGLTDSILKKVYHANAERLLGGIA